MKKSNSNILIITDEYPPLIGGAGIVAKQLYDDLKKEGNNVFVFFPVSKQNLIFKLFWPLFYFRIALIKKISCFDKIIVNDIRSAYFLSFISIFITLDFKKIHYIIHGTEYNIAYDPTFKNRIIFLPYFYNKFLLKIKTIISVSLYTKNLFLKHSTIKHEIENKIIVIYAGINKNLRVIKKDIKINKNDFFRLVTVSRLEKRKGHLEMLNIFSELLVKEPLLKWYIYGDGSIKQELLLEIKKRNLHDKVYLMGAMSRNDIYQREFLKYDFDLFWLLPNQPEAFGLVYIEASAAGVPALGIEKYGIKESVNNLFYTDNKSLLSLIKDIKDNKIFFVNNAIQFSEKFKSEVFSKKISNL